MLKNKTKGTILAKKYNVCDSFFSQAKGLMFARKPRTVILSFSTERKIGIHMWFVFFPIDTIWLDKNKKVVKIIENIKPFSFQIPCTIAKYVVEFQAGFISKRKIAMDDQIDW